MSKLEYMVLAILVIEAIRLCKETNFDKLLFPKLRQRLKWKIGNLIFYVKNWRNNGNAN